MSNLRKPIVQTRRDAWVEINLGYVEHNIKTLKRYLSGNTLFLAVVKADAYGHGADMIASTLVASGADALGVASVDEGIQLRNAGISVPIIVLGATPDWAFTSAVENDITLSIFSEEHINSCIHTYKRLGKKPQIHIKVDTGMNRIGISCNESLQYIKKVSELKEIELKGIFSHLACAENPEITQKQKQRWENLINQIENKENLILHLVNTAGMIGYKDMNYGMARAGIGIYGLFPDLHKEVLEKPDLKQVISLKGRITYLKEVSKNSGISYGYSYITQSETSKIATIPVGYADGVPRSLSNNIYGVINGNKVKQVGNITMDQIMFDVTEVENVKTGDIITLLGEDGGEFISINDWADKLNTINYELTCRLRVRLPRVYTRSRQLT
ncbi:MAG TPA: alanine racemase [Candidatus Gastranaerophilales bacterium]|nr:alanine racemase [Candidatus Gastranaerophilales bacterium]